MPESEPPDRSERKIGGGPCTPDPGLKPQRTTWSTYLLLGLCTLLAVLARGYSFGKEDQNLYLPFVFHWMDPSLFPHDHLLSLGYARESVVWGLLAVAGRFVPLPALLLGLYLLVSYLVLLVAHRTALAWWGSRRAAWIAVFLWMPAYSLPGVANTTFDDYFTTRILGTLFGMLALDSMARRRDRLSGLFLFLGGLCHIISMVPVAGGMALATLSGRRWRALAACVLGLLAAAFGLFVIGAFTGHPHPLFERYTGPWLDLVQQSAPELFPHRWPGGAWIRVVLYPLLLLGILAARRREGAVRGHLRDVAWVGAGVLLGEAIGFFASVTGFAIVIQLCLFRGQWILLYLLALVLAGTLAESLEGAGAGRALAVFGAATFWVTGDWVLQAVGLFLAVALSRRKELEGLCSWVLARRERVLSSLLVVLAATVFWQASRLLGWWYPSIWAPDRRAMLVAALSAVLVTLLRSRIPRLREGGDAVLLPVAAAFKLVLIPSTFLLASLGSPTFVGRLGGPSVAGRVEEIGQLARKSEALANVGALVRRSVPKGATVIVPPDWANFRLLSLRSPYITYKDRGPVEFDREYGELWSRRIREIHGLAKGKSGWRRDPSLDLSPEEVRELSDRHRAIRLDYLVTPRNYNLPLVGEASGYRLYRITAAGP